MSQRTAAVSEHRTVPTMGSLREDFSLPRSRSARPRRGTNQASSKTKDPSLFPNPAQATEADPSPDQSQQNVGVFDLCITAGDVEGKLTFVSERFQKVFGFSSEECIGRTCSFLQGDGTDMEAVRRLGEAARNPTGLEIVETLLNYTKDGSLVWNRVHLIPLRGPGQEFQGSIGLQLLSSSFDALDVYSSLCSMATLEPVHQIEDIIEASSPKNSVSSARTPPMQRTRSNLTPVLRPFLEHTPMVVLPEAEAYFVTLALGSTLRAKTLASLGITDQDAADPLLSVLCHRWSSQSGLEDYAKMRERKMEFLRPQEILAEINHLRPCKERQPQLQWHLLLIALNTGLAVLFAFVGQNTKLQPCGDVTPLIAQVSARLFVLYTAVALLTRMILTLTRLQHRIGTTRLPFAKVTKGLHRTVGLMAFLCALIHTGAHLFNLFYDPSTDCINAMTGSYDHHESLTNMKYLGTTVVGITGWLLVLVFILMVASAIKLSRAATGITYRSFLSIHNLYVLLVILAIVHSPYVALYLGPAILLFAADKMKLRDEQISVTATFYHIPRTDVVKISFNGSEMNTIRVGQYMYLARNDGSYASEFHPISIASSAFSSHSVCAYVLNSGKWSEDLLVTAKQSKTTEVANSLFVNHEKTESDSIAVGVAHNGPVSDDGNVEDWKELDVDTEHPPTAAEQTTAVQGTPKVTDCNRTEVADYTLTRRGSELTLVSPNHNDDEVMTPLELPLTPARVAATAATNSHFAERAAPLSARPLSASRSREASANPVVDVSITVRGPLFAQAELLMQQTNVVVITAGIGVTPYLGILASLADCLDGESRELPCGSKCNVETLAFHWINPTFDMFQLLSGKVLDRLFTHATNGKVRFSMNCYVTQIGLPSDLGSVFWLDFCQEMYNQRLCTNVAFDERVRLYFGRPNWREMLCLGLHEFKTTVSKACTCFTNTLVHEPYCPHQVDATAHAVFFCGPAQMGKVIEKRLREFEETSVTYQLFKETFN